ncbi:hypothetical protein L345_18133, partial [Ophiophagus hannah]
MGIRGSRRGNELNEHLETIDSSLDHLQNMLTTHSFSVDTSALLDPFRGGGGHEPAGSGQQPGQREFAETPPQPPPQQALMGRG